MCGPGRQRRRHSKRLKQMLSVRALRLFLTQLLHLSLAPFNMTFSSSYKYSALAQNDPEAPEELEMNSLEGYSAVDFGDPSQSVMEYGMPEGSYDSVFTYAPYNDLDKMGYMGPAR